jgi:hypothetical protein
MRLLRSISSQDSNGIVTERLKKPMTSRIWPINLVLVIVYPTSSSKSRNGEVPIYVLIVRVFRSVVSYNNPCWMSTFFQKNHCVQLKNNNIIMSRTGRWLRLLEMATDFRPSCEALYESLVRVNTRSASTTLDLALHLSPTYGPLQFPIGFCELPGLGSSSAVRSN